MKRSVNFNMVSLICSCFCCLNFWCFLKITIAKTNAEEPTSCTCCTSSMVSGCLSLVHQLTILYDVRKGSMSFHMCMFNIPIDVYIEGKKVYLLCLLGTHLPLKINHIILSSYLDSKSYSVSPSG